MLVGSAGPVAVVVIASYHSLEDRTPSTVPGPGEVEGSGQGPDLAIHPARHGGDAN